MVDLNSGGHMDAYEEGYKDGLGADRGGEMSAREQIRRLAEAATPGPWTYDGRDIFTVQMTEGGGRLVLPLPETWHESQQVNKADARYIAAVSPDVVLSLLDELAESDRTP